MAAYVAGNYGVRDDSGNFTNTRLILKEELRKTWFVYHTQDGTVFRPYPVFDQNGNCCPPLGNPDSQREVDILPDAFAALKVATYAGLGKNVEFIDYCSNIDQYNTEGAGYLKTPYEYLVLALRKMVPPKNNSNGKTVDGFPTPRALKDLVKYGVPSSNNCVLCRGALLATGKGQVNNRAAIDGVLYTAVICIKQQSAVNRFFELLKTVKEDSQPLSPHNTIVSSMFNLNGCTFQVQSQASEQQGKPSTQYSLVKVFDQTYAPNFSRVFQVPATDQGYWDALRNKLFVSYQSIGDIFNTLTVEEMVDVLKANYPISWIWYALKDSPYASLVTPLEQQKALADPEMTGRFGMQQQQGGYVEPPQQGAGIQRPNWGSPNYGGYNNPNQETYPAYNPALSQNEAQQSPSSYAQPSYQQPPAQPQEQPDGAQSAAFRAFEEKYTKQPQHKG